MPQWESYEQVGNYLLDQLAAEFGYRVEGNKRYLVSDQERLGKLIKGCSPRQ